MPGGTKKEAEQDTHVYGADHLVKGLVVETLRCDVEDLERAVPHSVLDRERLFRGKRRVEGGGGHALATQSVDLILHERDERRHNDGQAREEESPAKRCV